MGNQVTQLRLEGHKLYVGVRYTGVMVYDIDSFEALGLVMEVDKKHVHASVALFLKPSSQ